MKFLSFGALILFSVLLSAQKSNLVAGLLDHNLVQNPDADIPVSGTVTPGWGHIDTVQVETYGHISGEFDYNWGDTRGLGEHYFRFSAAEKTKHLRSAGQHIDLSPLKDSIRTGHLLYDLSGFFGTFRTRDYGAVKLVAIFSDAAGNTLSVVETGTTHYSEIRFGDCDLIKKQKLGSVPAGTRHVRLYMEATGMTNGDTIVNDTWVAFADHLNFSLHMLHKK